MKYKLFLAITIFSTYRAFSQNAKVDEWIKLLKIDNSKQVFAAATVEDTIGRYDTIHIKNFVLQLEKATANSNLRLQARVLSLKARLLFYKLEAGDSLYATVMKEALEKAYRLDDSYMIAEFSRWYGEMLNTVGQKSKASQYCVNALKMQEELGFENFPSVQTFFFSTGNILYDECSPDLSLKYFIKGLEFGFSEKTDIRLYAGSLNSAGFIYHLIGKQDSSLIYLLECRKFTREHKIPDLNYLSFANSFKPYFVLKQFDSCKLIADKIYKASLSGDEDMLAEASKMYGQLAQQNKQYPEAVRWLLKFVEISKKLSLENYQAYYKNLSDCYEKLGQADKAFFYYKEFKSRNDSIARSKLAANELLLMADATYQKERRDFKEINKKQHRQTVLAGTIIALVLLILAFVIFSLRKKKKNIEAEKKQAEQKSIYFETKYNTADEQLLHLKEIVIIKENEISALQLDREKIAGEKKSSEEIENLSRQVILTENDWEQFKENFTSVYPAFFTILKTMFPDITNAEQRMAALLRLSFDVKHIASMLGISQNSVHKTRYRLRKRVTINDNDDELAGFIASL